MHFQFRLLYIRPENPFGRLPNVPLVIWWNRQRKGDQAPEGFGKPRWATVCRGPRVSFFFLWRVLREVCQLETLVVMFECSETFDIIIARWKFLNMANSITTSLSFGDKELSAATALILWENDYIGLFLTGSGKIRVWIHGRTHFV